MMHLLSVVVLGAMAFQVDTMPPMDMGHEGHEMAAGHEMPEVTFAGGWRVTGMAQAFPIVTLGVVERSSPLSDYGLYLTQAAAMVNLESPGRRLVLRVTPNLEGLTQPDGELTFGAWGEGFIDARHPHTYVHEAMLSWNVWDTGLGSFSLSGGKGFAPYGTDDPMARPSVKYPTNHHLSQILERFTVNASWYGGPWSLEAGVFGGSEPESPSDFSNVESFGDSWSARVIRRFGGERMGQRDIELGASIGRVVEGAHEVASGSGPEERTLLYNAALRVERPVPGADLLYGLVEYSWSDPEHDEGYWSFLAEALWSRGRHAPYVRYELAVRPEFPRASEAGGSPDDDHDGHDPGEDFFRYDHDAEPVGATIWSILSVGYGIADLGQRFSFRPFVELQLFDVAAWRGNRTAVEILGDDTFAALTFGARVYFGGGPMRMGSYGVFDPMTRMGR